MLLADGKIVVADKGFDIIVIPFFGEDELLMHDFIIAGGNDKLWSLLCNLMGRLSLSRNRASNSTATA